MLKLRASAFSRPVRRVLALSILSAAVAGVALAYYANTGRGSAQGSVGVLSPATIAVPATSGASVTITWTSQASLSDNSQNSGVRYTVQRKLGSGGTYSTLGSGGCGGSLPYGTGSCTDTVSTNGTYFYEVIAHFGGNAWSATSNEVSTAATVAQATTTTLTSGHNPSVAGEQVTYTATVSTGSGTPTGTVTFRDGASTMSCESGSVSFNGSTATCKATYASVTGGSPHAITAVYSGDSNYLGSTSNEVDQTVNKANPTLSLAQSSAPSAGSGTAGTAISASSITATLAASSGATASGTISFVYFQQATAPTTCTGGTTIGTGITASGNGTYHPSVGFTPTVAGNYWLFASYSGDSNNNGANSACPPGTVQEVVVAKASPTLSLVQSSAPRASSGTVGNPISASSITATLASSSGSNAGGSITFTYFQQATAPNPCTSGGTAIGTASVSGNGSYNPNAGFTPSVAGTYWLYASYSGDADNNSAASFCDGSMTASQEIIVTAPPALTYSATGTATTWTSASTQGVAYPASTSTNDLLLLVLVEKGNTTPTVPAAWNALPSTAVDNTGGVTTFVYWKLAAGENSVSVTAANANAMSAWIVRYVRPGGYPPIPATAGAAVSGGSGGVGNTSTTQQVTTPTTAAPNATVISIVGDDGSGTLSLSTANGFTRQNQTANNGLSFGVADEVVAASGTNPAAPTWSTSAAVHWSWSTSAFH